MNYNPQDIRKDKDFVKSKEFAEGLTEKFGVDLVKLFELASEKEILLPVSVFTEELSSLETVSKYLHENLNLSFKKIGQLMNRSEKTIWQAYNFSLKKFQKRLAVAQTKHLIPISVFSDRRLSNLEAIVLFLKTQYDLKFSEIGALLHRDQRTIWTVHHRAIKKRNT